MPKACNGLDAFGPRLQGLSAAGQTSETTPAKRVFTPTHPIIRGNAARGGRQRRLTRAAHGSTPPGGETAYNFSNSRAAWCAASVTVSPDNIRATSPTRSSLSSGTTRLSVTSPSTRFSTRQ